MVHAALSGFIRRKAFFDETVRRYSTGHLLLVLLVLSTYLEWCSDFGRVAFYANLVIEAAGFITSLHAPPCLILR